MEGLEHEHHIIERVVAAMVVLAEKLQSGKEVEALVLNDLVEFLQVFAEDCHHGKEEHYLFPLLEKRRSTGERVSAGSLAQRARQGAPSDDKFEANLQGVYPIWKHTLRKR
jgi:hemerythrin-like domain-containing protein